MYYYFSSAFPAAIKFNGIYYGVISDTVKSIDFNDKLPFVEVCPLGNNQRQINFFPDNDFLSKPPNDVLITDLSGGFLIKFLKNTKVGDFKVLRQKKEANLLATVLIENGLKVSIETNQGFFADCLDFCADNAHISTFSLSGENFCLISFTGQENAVAAYSLGENISRVFFRQTDHFSTDGGFFTTENFADIAKHKVQSEWEYTGGGFKQKQVHVERDSQFDIQSLNKKILPFAFLEEILCGGNPVDFLTESLAPNADRLREYLGDFIGIMPPPIFRSQDQIGLIYHDGTNKYKTKYCIVELTDRKVSNVKLID